MRVREQIRDISVKFFVLEKVLGRERWMGRWMRLEPNGPNYGYVHIGDGKQQKVVCQEIPSPQQLNRNLAESRSCLKVF